MKIKKIVGFLLLIIGIILIIIGTVMSSSNNKKKETVEKTKTKSTEVVEEISLDTVFPYDLVDSVTMSEYSDYSDYLYLKDKLNVEDINNQVLLSLAARKYLYANNTTTMTSEDMKKSIKSLFGNVKYKDTTINAGSCLGESAEYKKGKYSFAGDCGGSYISHFITKIVKATRYKDRVEIIQKVGYADYDFPNDEVKELIYKDNSLKDLIGKEDATNDTVIYEKYKDSFPEYMFTFNYEDEEYHFESIELLK